MTTRAEYAEAAEWFDFSASEQREHALYFVGPSRESFEKLAAHQELASSVLRALADGAVLCRLNGETGRTMDWNTRYIPLDPQP